MPISEAYNEDNMIGMGRYPDGYFDLAIIDPPYGKKIDNAKKGNFVMTKHKSVSFDGATPDANYWHELFRVSKNQIVFGCNYFLDFLPATKCMIVWDKVNPMPGKFSDFELAWTSFPGASRIYKQAWIGFGRKFIERSAPIHPTQKPLKLYEWILQTFGNGGGLVLDTHMGSQSSRIAAFNMGFDYYGWEIDPDYFEAGNKRFRELTTQLKLI